jgi:hypothetical protein
MRRAIQILTFAVALSGSASVLADIPVEATQPAKWVNRDVNFTYQGFTTTYSCDGLLDNAVIILTALGARKQDLNVKETPCASRGASDLSFAPGIRGTIFVLVPATAEEIAANDPGIVPAHWTSVDLVRKMNSDTRLGGNCELLEQAKRHLLPLFTRRNLNYSSNCVPHEVLMGGTFKVDVLQMDQKPAVH